MPLASRPIAICSCSVGRAFAGHDLRPKLAAIAQSGFTGVELFFEDLEWFAHNRRGGAEEFRSSFTASPLNLPSEEEILDAAKAMRTICDELGLKVITIQPLQSFEGNLDPTTRAAGLTTASLYLRVATLLSAPILQVTSHYSRSHTTGALPVLAADLAELADLAAEHGVKVAYEGISWAAYVSTWQEAWEVVKLADRPKLGILLDTYHILAREWADPTTPTGLRDPTLSLSNARLQRSLSALFAVPLDKITHIQLSDALRLESPLDETHEYWDAGLMGPLHMWSRSGRVFPYEGYTPVDQCVKAMLVDRPYDGWVSIETFCASMREPGEDVPVEHARRGMESWKKLVEAVSGM